MHNGRIGRLVVATILALALPAAAMAQDEGATTDEVSDLLVVSTASGSIEGDTLRLEGSPAIIWFSDRPVREAGHMDVETFMGLWSSGADDFSQDPPNAVLSTLGEGVPSDAVIELTGVTQDGDDLVFDIELIAGELPTAEFGANSLFIDNFSPCPGC